MEGHICERILIDCLCTLQLLQYWSDFLWPRELMQSPLQKGPPVSSTSRFQTRGLHLYRSLNVLLLCTNQSIHNGDTQWLKTAADIACPCLCNHGEYYCVVLIAVGEQE